MFTASDCVACRHAALPALDIRVRPRWRSAFRLLGQPAARLPLHEPEENDMRLGLHTIAFLPLLSFAACGTAERGCTRAL